MHLRTAVVVSLAAAVSARIYGIGFPKTIKAGDEVTAIIGSANYIQSVYDVAIAFGINREAAAFPDTLGPVLGSFYLGPERSNQLHNFPQPVSIPENLEEGRYVIAAALLSLYGASVNPVLVGYNVTVTIGEETSEDYVNSWD